jgi:uncharacterized protein YciI
MPLFLYCLKAGRPELLSSGPTPEEQTVIARHEAYLRNLRDQGVIVLAGRTETVDYATFAMIVLQAESEAEARRVVSSDPAVAERVMRAELSPYRVTMLGDLAELR